MLIFYLQINISMLIINPSANETDPNYLTAKNLSSPP
nr:MAG TPA: hypothetical protein [Caudoviricetes sp.]